LLLHTFSIAPFFVILCFINPNSCSQQISVRSTTLLLFARGLQTGEPAGITREEMTVVASESRVIINTGQMHEIASLHLRLPAENAQSILFNRSWGMYVCSSPSFFLVLFKIQCFERERERERENVML
jgi:hypothetical protein